MARQQPGQALHDYLNQTEYAVRGLFTLIGDEDLRLVDMQRKLEVASKERAYAQSILYAGAPPSGFGENTTPYFEKTVRDAKHKIATLTAGIGPLEAAVSAKAFSVNALAGAILQIAKQGIVVARGSLSGCPPGRTVGPEVLSNVIWQARNQAMHWEEVTFNAQVKACFENLARAFGAQFCLVGTVRSSRAKVVINLLGWSSFDAYALDMQSLIG